MLHEWPPAGPRRSACGPSAGGGRGNRCRNATSGIKNVLQWRKVGSEGREKGSPPISRVLSSGLIVRSAHRAIIPLVDALPRRSSSLPGDSASSVSVPLFGLAPDGVCHAVRVTTSAVGSYPTVSPLPCPKIGRFLFCGAFPRVAPAGRYPAPSLHGVRTFLDSRPPRSSGHPRTCPVRLPPRHRQQGIGGQDRRRSCGRPHPQGLPPRGGSAGGTRPA